MCEFLSQSLQLLLLLSPGRHNISSNHNQELLKEVVHSVCVREKKKKATPPDETHPWGNVGRRLITGADKKLVQIQNRPRDDQLTAALKTFNPVIKSRWQNCRITCTNIQGSVFFKACTHTHTHTRQDKLTHILNVKKQKNKQTNSSAILFPVFFPPVISCSGTLCLKNINKAGPWESFLKPLPELWQVSQCERHKRQEVQQERAVKKAKGSEIFYFFSRRGLETLCFIRVAGGHFCIFDLIFRLLY